MKPRLCQISWQSADLFHLKPWMSNLWSAWSIGCAQTHSDSSCDRGHRHRYVMAIHHRGVKFSQVLDGLNDMWQPSECWEKGGSEPIDDLNVRQYNLIIYHLNFLKGLLQFSRGWNVTWAIFQHVYVLRQESDILCITLPQMHVFIYDLFAIESRSAKIHKIRYNGAKEKQQKWPVMLKRKGKSRLQLFLELFHVFLVLGLLVPNIFPINKDEPAHAGSCLSQRLKTRTVWILEMCFSFRK